MLFGKMRETVYPIMNQIHEAPFNLELSKGTLPKEKFIYYMEQDALYLADYSRALAITGARLPNNSHAQQFIEFALGAIKAERELHFKYIANHTNSNLTLNQNSSCFNYTNYLLRMATTASVEEAVASLLPCLWVYHEVGLNMAAVNVNDAHPYQEWIKLYASEEFGQSVKLAIDITNELGMATSETIKNNMLIAFLRSTKLEWHFWDEAYHC